MSGPPDDLLVMPIEAWPTGDRALWEAGQAGDPLLGEGDGYFAGLRPASVRFASRAYGRWLAVLQARGVLDRDVPPAARAIPANAEIFLRALQAKGNANSSIVARFLGLRSALRIMQPEVDTAWLTAPGGQTLHSRFPAVRREIFVPDSQDLYAWGLSIADAARGKTLPRQLTRYRNGAILALLAARAPRIRALSEMRLERNLQRDGARIRVIYHEDNTKTGIYLAYDLPDRLAIALGHYLDVVRPALLTRTSRRHDAVWVGQEGEPFGLIGIQQMIRRATGEHFPEVFGPQRFRHAMATTAPIADPSRPTAVAAVLGHSKAMTEACYNRGRSELAAQAMHTNLDAERERTRMIAGQLFGGRLP